MRNQRHPDHYHDHNNGRFYEPQKREGGSVKDPLT